MAEKKMSVSIEGKHVLAAFDVPKSGRKHLESRRILQGVHVRADKDGRWMVEGCDTYKLARISNGYVGGKHAWFDFTLPPETVAELKAADMLTFEPDLGKGTCKLVRMARGNVTEWEFNLLDGSYPDTDKLIPEGQPFGCYRYAHQVNADYLGVLMGVVRKSLGKGEGVTFSTQEGKPNRPVVGYAEGDGVEVTLLVMPAKLDGHHKLGSERPRSADEKALDGMREELEAARANAEMWKAKALEAEGKPNSELEADLQKARAERDRFAEKFRVEKAKRVEEKGDGKLQDKVKELEGQLKEARAELERVWKENEGLKRTLDAPKPPETKSEPKPTAEPAQDAAAEVSLATMQAWCEGKGLKAKQTNEKASIWVLGPSLPYKKELEDMGARWGTSKKYGKGWYIAPSAA